MTYPHMNRFAVYFTPERGSPLWEKGSAWLGRDAETDDTLPRPADAAVSLSGISAETVTALTADARRYGLHATLKPPFRLISPTMAAEFEDAVAAFALSTPAFRAPMLTLASLYGFLALTLSPSCERMRHLADTAVASLDRFRAPPLPDELARRRKASLSAEEERLLAQWGYPYVMERFRFHLTLTARLSEAERTLLRPVLEQHFGPVLGKPLDVSEISLFGEPSPSAAFRLLRRFPLGRRS